MMMKKLMVAAMSMCLGSAALAADPAVGLWQTQVDDDRYAHVKIAPCGNAVCGVIVKTFLNGEAYQSPNIGKTLVIDMAPKGGGAYAGKVWRPSNDKIYIGKMKVSGDALKLSGCVAGGLICSKQSWKRLP